MNTCVKEKMSRLDLVYFFAKGYMDRFAESANCFLRQKHIEIVGHAIM